MSNSTITEDADNLEETVQIYESYSDYCPRCYPLFSGQYILKLLLNLIVYIFGYSLYSRLFTLLLILQAAALWIGYSLNSVLQLLFIPFAYSSNKSTSNMDLSFLSCCFVLPGIISFSSHYFWFLIQFSFHCYASDETEEENIDEKTMSICGCCSKRGQQIKTINKADRKTNDNALLFFPQYKCIYRFIITLLMTIYIIFRIFSYSEDIFTALIVSLGLFPLVLMWFLHIIHLLGIYSFVKGSFNDKINRIDPPKSTTDDSDIQYVRISVLFLLVMVVTKCERQMTILGLDISYHILITFFLFSIYILLYNQTPIKIIDISNDQLYCCCCSNKNLSKEKNIFYTRNIFVRFIEKIIQASLSMKKNKPFHIYKLFILIIVYVMFISLNQILTHFFHEYKFLIISIVQSILILLWLPPFFNQKTNQWIIDKQIYLVQFLIVFMCLTSLVSILSLPYLYALNIRIAFFSLLFLSIYTVLLLFYYIAHWIKYSSSTVALIEWKKSHDSISIYMQAFSIMFMLLSLIGFFGFSVGSSIYAETMHNKNNSLSYPKMLSGSTNTFDNNEEQQYRMQACYWNFGNLNIQDMTLFAALAYMPTAELKSEINHFYPNNELIFDEEFHNYQEYGYGEITYYTLDTSEAVIVVIRGTTLLYEWFIDFDIWTESSINQMISILFPWSRLYPRTVHKIIVNQMSLLENIFSDKNSPSNNNDKLKQSSKRFYVKDMIKILERITIKYKNKPLILVGHSLGGGLAKLAGIALNNTAVVISVSGPGIAYSRAKYDETKNTLMETINKRIFNIIHDRDVVPWADKQTGLIQYITCPKAYSRLQCHSINPIFCNLLKNCGNPRNFRINKDICQP